METNANSLRIRCPHCGAELAVQARPGIETKRLTCPVCHETAPFREFKRPSDKFKEDLPTDDAVDCKANLTIGLLKTEDGKSFRLKAGRNVIGRKSTASSSDIQIFTEEDKRMSREHLVIDVRKEAGRGFVHYASLYKERVNETLINSMRLDYGDLVILKHKDLIRLPDCTLTFEIPDKDETEF